MKKYLLLNSVKFLSKNKTLFLNRVTYFTTVQFKFNLLKIFISPYLSLEIDLLLNFNPITEISYISNNFLCYCTYKNVHK